MSSKPRSLYYGTRFHLLSKLTIIDLILETRKRLAVLLVRIA
uniref:Uncharacterized protein n=1 Tax=Rhizophora mucronata TaxID=61149 RepID=A0A2P2LME9_RHIMU